MKFVQRALDSWRDTSGNQWFFSMVWLLSFPPILLYAIAARSHGVSASVAVASVCASLSAFLCTDGRRQYLRVLKSRDEAQHDFKWDIVLNGVKAGEIADADYVRIRLDVYGNNQVWGPQFSRYVRRAVGTFAQVAIVLPGAAVFVVLVLGIVNPGVLAAALRAIGQSSPSDITAWAYVLLWLTCVVCGVQFFLSVEGGITRIVENEVTLRVRRLIGEAADGEMSLVRYVDDEPVLYREDERAEARTLRRQWREARKAAKQTA